MSATHTPNLNLAKPDREDYVSVVADLNDNMDIIDAAFASIQNTLRKVPVSIAVGDWTLDDGVYYATFTTAYVTASSFEFVFFDSSYKTYAVSDINANKHSGGGGLDFDTATIPTGTITGTAYVFDTNDGKLPVIIENTVIDIANGGTGQSSLAGVQSAFGIGDLTQLHTVDKTNLVNAINENTDHIVTLHNPEYDLQHCVAGASGIYIAFCVPKDATSVKIVQVSPLGQQPQTVNLSLIISTGSTTDTQKLAYIDGRTNTIVDNKNLLELAREYSTVAKLQFGYT